jgi:hypothetical protein
VWKFARRAVREKFIRIMIVEVDYVSSIFCIGTNMNICSSSCIGVSNKMPVI